ncbi:YiiX/YebB-like N1pC/P60 family cysteine hydrolase [Luteolibacter flavescens]|uniref:YiiX/YebB-like N1pC/P60 family cysteine hydrolase n=1 Tax=Luteolibacter flavescens TaxID=1859460 RepID=A0ABT3FRE3_9BACT|nr:YiiX/YebB-like N1pC/P60 family cysteine hydrolase [Luteolibacter flavescens]MCW1886155.1 YiiX/YebB-like N1pC/P60 family cysteine hydrolase [Luteolibacter flavescens]
MMTRCSSSALVLSATLSLAGLASADVAAVPYDLREGDILFHGTGGQQADAVRGATDSPYTHCGVVLSDKGRLLVLEAVQPVSITTVEEFEKRSKAGTFHARRLKSAPDAAAVEKAKAWGKKQVGLNYDTGFKWGDDKLYCSELVWKVFHEAGVKLCEPRRFHDYKLDHPDVKPLIAQRYGSADKLPKNEPVVAPSDLAESDLLVEVPRVEKK